MSTLRDSALRLASYGFRVFPLSPGSKLPALDADWQRIATSDSAKVASLWTDPLTLWGQPFNIGIALDADVLVVDVDVRDGKRGAQSLTLLEILYEPLPPTLTVRTASGGEHRYYRVNGADGPFGKELAEHIDLKTLGGYVVGPGSTIDGGVYVSDGVEIAPFPPALLPVARRSARPMLATAGIADDSLDAPDAVARTVAYLERDAPDSGTYKVACRVKDFGVSEEMAVELLAKHWAEPRSLGKDVDHLAFRVRNAYAYGQSPVGVKSPEAEFEAVEVVDRRTKPARGKLYYERWRDSTALQAAPYLIRGWYDLGAMVVTYGESGVGKTNVVLNQAIAIATGQPWAGAKVRQGLVVYVAAEGGRGVRKRIAAYKARFALADIAIALVPCPVDLLRPGGDTKALIALIAEAEKDFGQSAVMVVIDTVARALAGGNENAPDDMGALVMHCDRIREATKATVHLIHHSGKNQAAGARGHSSLRAATDTEIEIGKGSVKGTKQRDMDFAPELAFDLEVVTIGRDDEGADIKSVVCHARRPTEFEEKVSQSENELLGVLRRLLAARGDTSVVGSRAWKTAAGLIQGDRTKDKAFDRDVVVLVRAGLVDVHEDGKGKEHHYTLTARAKADNVQPNCDKDEG